MASTLWSCGLECAIGFRLKKQRLLHFRRGYCVTANAFDPEAVVDAMLPLLGLTVTEESRAQTIVHLRIAAEHARKLLSVPLVDQDEPAPVFTA
jgi:hypothetical protein